LTFWVPYLPITKNSFSLVIFEADVEGIVISLPETPKNLGIVFPSKSENINGVPHELQLHSIFVFWPNLNPKVFVPTVDKQSPVKDTKEKLFFPPILNKEFILYPSYPESKSF
jgi:hypothetical protein